MDHMSITKFRLIFIKSSKKKKRKRINQETITGGTHFKNMKATTHKCDCKRRYTWLLSESKIKASSYIEAQLNSFTIKGLPYYIGKPPKQPAKLGSHHDKHIRYTKILGKHIKFQHPSLHSFTTEHNYHLL